MNPKSPATRSDVRCVHTDRVRSARRALATEENMRRLSNMFKALGDPTRLKIVLALTREELCVCDIAVLLGMTDSAISHQLRLLKHLRLVTHRKAGKMAYCSIDDEHVKDIVHLTGRYISEQH